MQVSKFGHWLLLCVGMVAVHSRNGNRSAVAKLTAFHLAESRHRLAKRQRLCGLLACDGDRLAAEDKALNISHHNFYSLHVASCRSRIVIISTPCLVRYSRIKQTNCLPRISCNQCIPSRCKMNSVSKVCSVPIVCNDSWVTRHIR